MNPLTLAVDPGGSFLKCFYTLESFKPELILMEPEVATVPLESLQAYEQSKVGSSSPENSAWIEYQNNFQAVGFLARKRFNADLQLQRRKFELALPKVLAMVGAIASKHELPNNSSIRLGILLPWGEYQDRALFQELITKALADYKFKEQSKSFVVDAFICLPEGGGILTRGRAPGSSIKDQTIAVIMLGYRDTSILVIERGEMSKGKTEPLGFSKMIESVMAQTSGLNAHQLTAAICKAGRNINPKALEELAAVDAAYKEHELATIRTAVTNGRKEYWMMLSNWLKLQVPRDVDEVIIGGGTAHYFRSQLNNLFSASTVNWCDHLESQITSNFSQVAAKSLQYRLTDVYGLFFYLCGNSMRQNKVQVGTANG
ncbi:ParM/StbA family protein [Anabaena azotica]|uniref:ParM/StbA family protein n=1 Tax=Anabaena azotica FACHB-119 TaxID=947527 RepID=A0ABR8DCG4_9NOST|nr:ParM/StbA family protein [Anabaena azotica]MBD2504050.1 ParM/StbA family protein [Anabaena azotica FACHB-119]